MTIAKYEDALRLKTKGMGTLLSSIIPMEAIGI